MFVILNSPKIIPFFIYYADHIVLVEMRFYKMRVSGPRFNVLFHVLCVHNNPQILFTKTRIFIS